MVSAMLFMPISERDLVPFVHEETFRLAPELGTEFLRSAAYVEIGLTEHGSRTLGVYVSHLHHMER